MARISMEFAKNSPDMEVKIEGCSPMQILAAAQVLQLEGEGAYTAMRMSQSQNGKGGLTIARGLPGLDS